jgi:tetratricopeptide (TPR) repeat protein
MPDPFKRALAFHAQGRIVEAEALYRTILDADPLHVGALHHLGLIRAGQRRIDEALALIGTALALEPDSAAAHYNMGTILQTEKRDQDAIRHFERAVALRPDHVEALSNLGNSLQALNRWEKAVACYERALAVRPGHAETHNNLGAAYAALERRDDAIAQYRQAVAAKPDYAEARINLGKALRGLNLHAEAIAEFEQALALRPGDIEASRSQGMARLILGDFKTGWLQWRFARRGAIPQPLWLGESALAGRTILLYAEQGYGDTIHFARYIKLAAQRGARIVLEVQPALISLLGSLPGVAAVRALGETLPPFDCYCPLLSLALAFGTELATIPAAVPYLAAPTGKAATRDASGAYRVGLTWSGNPSHLNDRNRSIPLQYLRPLLDRPGIEFIALQKEVRDSDAEALKPFANVTIVSEDLTDFAATAEILASLDLVISVDTAMAHLAGALGKNVWILLPFSPDWRWLLERSNSPWYPSARLFRQKAPGDWASVIAEVERELERVAALRC